MTGLNRAQYDKLIEGIVGSRVQNLKGNSHLEAWDVRRHLIRVFGFDGFDIETKALELVAQIEHIPGSIKRSNGGTNDRTAWTVVYRAEVRLSIKVGGKVIAVFEDGAAGDAANQPSLGDAHDMAAKTALSQGLKRCAVNLGDQFGLSLYNGGRQDPVVNRSLVVPEGGDASSAALPVDDAPVLPEPVAAMPAESVAEPEPARTPEPATVGDDAGIMPPRNRGRMFALFSELGQTDRDVQIKFINWALRGEYGDAAGLVTSRRELTADEGDVVIRALLDRKAQQARAKEPVAAS